MKEDKLNPILTTNKEIWELIKTKTKYWAYRTSIWFKCNVAKYFYLEWKLISKKDKKTRRAEFKNKTEEEKLKIYDSLFLDYPTIRFFKKLIWQMVIISILAIILVSNYSKIKYYFSEEEPVKETVNYEEKILTRYEIPHKDYYNGMLVLDDLMFNRANSTLTIDKLYVKKEIVKSVNTYLVQNTSKYELTKVEFSDKFIYLFVKVPYKYNGASWIPNYTVDESTLNKLGQALTDLVNNYTTERICVRYYMQYHDENNIYYTYIDRTSCK